MMITNNQHVVEYLTDYLDRDRPPHFAVMVKGPWGAGKTYLVKKLLESRPGGMAKSALYVSLYGVTSIRQIEEAFFAQVHPALANKSVRFGAKVLKGLLKGTLKIDLDGDGKDDGTLSPQAPDVDLVEMLKKVGDRVLVFDDLERCAMQPDHMLGYINAFVEHDGAKVIIIAHEDEIASGDEKLQRRYRTVREKAIGKSLTVECVVDEALDAFLAEISDQEARSFLSRADRRDALIALHQTCGSGNLRVLRQAIWDFERLFGWLDDPRRSDERLMNDLVTRFFVLAFEMRLDRLRVQDVTALMMRPILRGFDQSKSEDGERLDAIIDRYQSIDFNDLLLSDGLWVDMLFRGRACKNELLNELGERQKLRKVDDEPAWVTIWYALLRPTPVFEAARDEFERQIAAREFVDQNVLIHVIGLRIWMARQKIIRKSATQVVREMKAYIDDLFQTEKINDDFDNEIGHLHGLLGLAVYERGTEEFKELIKHLGATIAKAKERRVVAISGALLTILRDDPAAFATLISRGDTETRVAGIKGDLRRVPVLAPINPKEFADAALSLSPQQQLTVFQGLHKRFDENLFDRVLKREVAWATKLLAVLHARKRAARGIERARLGEWIDSYVQPHVPEKTKEAADMPSTP